MSDFDALADSAWRSHCNTCWRAGVLRGACDATRPCPGPIAVPLFVYFVQAGGELGPIKIGHSANVKRRIDRLQTGNHLQLALLAHFEHADAPRIESELHARFADLRLEGEWFRFDARILDAIANLTRGGRG